VIGITIPSPPCFISVSDEQVVNQIFETNNKAVEDSLQKIAYNISQVPSQIPAVLPPVPAALPGLPQGIPQAAYPQLPPQAAVPAPPPPQLYAPQVPQGYPQLPQGYPQLPQGYPQLPQGYPQGYPQVPPTYNPVPAVPVPGAPPSLVNAGGSATTLAFLAFLFVFIIVMLVICIKRGMQGKFDIDPDVVTGKEPNTTLTFKNPLSGGGDINPHCEGEHNPAYSNDNIDQDTLAPPARSKRSRQKSGGRSEHSNTDESICMDYE